MVFPSNSQLYSSTSSATNFSSSSRSSKGVKSVKASTLSKFISTSTISQDEQIKSTSENGKQAITPKIKPQQPAKGRSLTEVIEQTALNDEEYKVIASKLKRASSQEILAYYNKFGDMWFNEFPKTDYLYSPTSQNYGKEAAPGIPLKPNMSRSPIRTQKYESLSTSRKTTVDSSYEASERLWASLDSESNANLTNELREKALLSTKTYLRSSRKTSESKFYEKWYRSIISILTFCYCSTVGRIFSGSRNSSMHQSYSSASLKRSASSNISSHKWYYFMTRFFYWSLFLFQRIDVKVITSLRSALQKIFSPLTSNSRHRMKPVVLLTLCLPLFLLFVLFHWPELYTSLYSYLSEIVVFNPVGELSNTVSSISHSSVGHLSELNIYWLFRPFITVWNLTSSVLSSGFLLFGSTIYYIFHLLQSGILFLLNLLTIPFMFLTLKLGENSVSDEIIKPKAFQNPTSLKSLDIDYKALVETILNNEEVNKTLYKWFTEQFLHFENTRKKTGLDSAVLGEITVPSELFQNFLRQELDKRDSKTRKDLLQSIEQKSLLLEAEVTALDKKLNNLRTEESQTRISLHKDLSARIDELQAGLNVVLTKSSIESDQFKQFLAEELDKRKKEIQKELQRSLEEKNAELKEDLASLKRKLHDYGEGISSQQIFQAEISQKFNRIQNHLNQQTIRFHHFSSRISEFSPKNIEKQVTDFLMKLLSNSNQELNQSDIGAYLDSYFVARDMLDMKLSNLTYHLDNRIKEASLVTMDKIMEDVSDKMSQNLLGLIQEAMRENESSVSSSSSPNWDSIKTYIENTVNHILSIYDADKTGMMDFALESAGGSILALKCADVYTVKRSFSLYTYLNFPYFSWNPTPSIIIQPGVQPGECFPFFGSTALFIIQLSAKIKVKTFSIEHIPKSLSRSGKIDSAPKDFTVLGLDSPESEESYSFGKFRFEENGTSLQFFPAKEFDRAFNIVGLQVLSNWGHPEYTCLYRIRVHGTAVN